MSKALLPQWAVASWGGRWLAITIWLVAAVLLSWSNVYAPIREKTFDFLQLAAMSVSANEYSAPPQVWVVAFDDDSMAKLGRWPISRVQLGDLVERIAARAPKAIGLDILLIDASPSPADDLWLRKSLAETDRMILAHPVSDIDSGDYITDEEKSMLAVERIDGLQHIRSGLVWMDNWLVPSSIPFDQYATSHGFITYDWTTDTIIRRMPLLVANQDYLMASFALAHALVYWDSIEIQPKMVEQDLRAWNVLLDDRVKHLAVDDGGFVRPKFNHARQERHISAADFLDRPQAYQAIQDGIVIIGATALVTGDFAYTAFGKTAGVEIHAQFLESILTNSFWLRPSFLFPIEVGAAVLAAGIVVAFAPALTLTGVGLLFMGIAITAAVAAFTTMLIADLLFDPTLILASAGLIWLVFYALRTAIERRRRRIAEDAKLKLETEMSSAREIQNSILPDLDNIEGLPRSVSARAELVQANFVGGDFYDAFMIDDERLFVIVADVSGKGPAGAFFMAITKAFIQSYALEGRASLGDVIARAEQEIMRNNPHELFVTAIAVILNVRSGQFEACNAGHPPPLVIGRDGQCDSVQTIDAPPIGMVPGFNFRSNQHQLLNGQSLILFTDGLADLTDAGNGSAMGDLRKFVCDVMKSNGVLPSPETVVKNAIGHLGRAAEDDITLLVLHFT